MLDSLQEKGVVTESGLQEEEITGEISRFHLLVRGVLGSLEPSELLDMLSEQRQKNSKETLH